MVFRPEEIDNFRALFEERKQRIGTFPGCRGVELLQDTNDPGIFFTYSHWDGPEHLEQYRQSELFQDTWARTKVLFAGKPEAWSVDVVSKAPAP